MSRRVSLGLAALRITGVAALGLLLWSPPWLPPARTTGPPLVLLDASLSFAGTGGRWAEALDSARRLARGGVVWRFGDAVAAFDSLPPAAGASRLAPALAAAAARAGPVVVITDGEIGDLAVIPADLRTRARVVTLARPAFRDAYVASVSGPRRLAAGDTLRLTVAVGVAGSAEPGAGSGTVVAQLGGRRVASRPIVLPDSGMVVVELEVPASRLPAGPAALTVGLDGAGDAETRDDARIFIVETAARPAVVVLADPPSWELRFLASALADVVRAPVRSFVRLDRAAPWRDGATLRPVREADVVQAIGGARLVVHGPEPAIRGAVAAPARLIVAGSGGVEGDWYVAAPPPSPLAATFAGIAWDSLPPLSAVIDAPPDSGTIGVLVASRARRGRPVPVVTLRASGAARVATLGGDGFWRWGFRGGASEAAYRAVVAGVADWLLQERGARSGERFAPLTLETPRGLPVTWVWRGAAAAQDVAVRLTSAAREQLDTLRFDAGGRAELRLAPGVYRYAAVGGPERGMVAVEEYSDEWRPRAVELAAQPGTAGLSRAGRGLRESWWLFALAIAAFAAEWYWRRREGLP